MVKTRSSVKNAAKNLKKSVETRVPDKEKEQQEHQVDVEEQAEEEEREDGKEGKETDNEGGKTKLSTDGALTDAELPACDPSLLDPIEKERLLSEILYSPDIVFGSHSLDPTELKEYMANALFLLAENNEYGPNEVVSLQEQGIEVVIRSTFDELDTQFTSHSKDKFETQDLAHITHHHKFSLDNLCSKTPQASINDEVTTDSANSSCKNINEIDCITLRTYVTENSKGQTVNHVRPHDIWQRGLPEMTFLDLLSLVNYDPEEALINLEIILYCQKRGEILPADVAKVEQQLRCRQALDEKAWSVEEEREFQLHFFKYRMQFTKIYKAMLATRSKGIAASNKITRKGQTAVSVPRRRTAMPQSTRDVIRHFHYVFKRPQPLNGGLVQEKRRRGRRGVDGVMRNLLPWHFDKRMDDIYNDKNRSFRNLIASCPAEPHTHKCPRCTFKNESIDLPEKCQLCGHKFDALGNRRSMRRRRKTTFDGGIHSDDTSNESYYQFTDNQSRGALERTTQMEFSTLPHPLLESFVEAFLIRVRERLKDEPAGTQYNRHTKLDGFARILNDYVDGSLPTNVAEAALRDLLNDGHDELLVKDFDFLLRTLWHVNIDHVPTKKER